ncbi:YkuJ family protein [Liquorilactobacillus sicerae]|uniref:YkuJ family protein n=1 Tax=Liquorilactobacillus sicerae TaxID=1416943 RepID=UPI00248191B2|nr:YkuJ family protein [Liquorilactobacillus sicerae]
MAASKLAAIISRLESMITAGDGESRRFEKNGQQVATVNYDSESKTFKLNENKSQQVFEFDDVDLVAMEIYDLLAD